jgi:hypothetical protein
MCLYHIKHARHERREAGLIEHYYHFPCLIFSSVILVVFIIIYALVYLCFTEIMNVKTIFLNFYECFIDPIN